MQWLEKETRGVLLSILDFRFQEKTKNIKGVSDQPGQVALLLSVLSSV